MIKLDNITLPIGFNESKIKEICAVNLRISTKNIKNNEILKLSLDARRKNNIKYVTSVALELDEKTKDKFPSLSYQLDRSLLSYQQKDMPLSPVVVGFGPSGMFAGLALARMGFKPIILEQGKPVDERQKDVENFWNNGEGARTTLAFK